MKPAKTTNRLCAAIGFGAYLLFGSLLPAGASHHYTAKQMEALASRVGQSYWSLPLNGKGANFVATPTANGKPFRIDTVESFQITELVGQAAKDPYYKIKRENGQEGYISPEQFLEAFNLTIVTTDPAADDKRKLAEANDADKKRIDWIHKQAWSPAIKEAAIKKQPIPGWNTNEVKNVLGAPTRVTKMRGPIKTAEEQWLYPNGSVLIFNNGLLSRVERPASK